MVHDVIDWLISTGDTSKDSRIIFTLVIVIITSTSTPDRGDVTSLTRTLYP
jgi:hypothetical protein